MLFCIMLYYIMSLFVVDIINSNATNIINLLIPKAQTENGFLQIQPVVDSFESLMQRVKGRTLWQLHFMVKKQEITHNGCNEN